MLDKGIILVSFGTATYAKYAYNMAYSIKHYCQSLPIFYYTDGVGLDQIDQSIFDKVVIQEFNIKDPGINKINLFTLSPFEKTLYLDVDGVCLKDIRPLFDNLEGSGVFAQVIDSGSKSDKIGYSIWAENSVIWDHFKLPEEAILPALQTSIIYFDRSKKALNFFSQLEENYKCPLEKDKYSILWGMKKYHPDELYYSGTMAQVEIMPDKRIQPIFFPDKIEEIKTIFSDYYILSHYGAQALIRPYAHDLYNRHMSSILRENKKEHLFKAQGLYKNKMIGIK